MTDAAATQFRTAAAIQALRLLANSPRSAPELAEDLYFGRRSARRLANELHRGGYVELVPGDRRRRWRLSQRARRLGYDMWASTLSSPGGA